MKFFKEYGNQILVLGLALSLVVNMMTCSTQKQIEETNTENALLKKENRDLERQLIKSKDSEKYWIKEAMDQHIISDSLRSSLQIISVKYDEVYKNIGRVRGYDSLDSLLSRYYK